MPFTDKTKTDKQSKLLRTKSKEELKAMLRKASLRAHISMAALPPTGIMGGLGLKEAAVVGLAYHSTPAAIVVAVGTVAVMVGVTIFMVKAINREEKILDALKTL